MFLLPPRSIAVTQICKEQGVIGGTVAVLGRITSSDRRALPARLEVESDWQSEYALPTEDNKSLGITRTRQWVEVDDAGVFHVCGLAKERRFRLQLRMGRQPIADTVVVSAGSGPVYEMEWELPAERLASAVRGDPGSLTGSIVDANSGRPLAGVEVWIPLSDARITTDSAGRFQFKDLPPGGHIVQLRRVGYVMQHDTLALAAGVDAKRDYRLVSQTAILDTVRATAARAMSPSLRDFDERRAKGIGQFVTEAELRKNDNRTLADVLKRIPGVSVRIGPGAREYVATSRSGGLAPGSLAGGSQPSADPSIRTSPRGCWLAVYVDGTAIYLGPPQPAPDVARMQVRDYAAVELYSGNAALPVQFSAIRSSDCGVLLLWSRER
jgi:protocatechuate 3,4-dioxygenase beta subunit